MINPFAARKSASQNPELTVGAGEPVVDDSEALQAALGAPIPFVPPGWRRWVATENLGLLLTLSYIGVSAVGMLHSALVFFIFRLNIFDYAEPSDFLMAALRDPLIIILCLLPIPLLTLYYRLAYWMQARSKTRSWMYGGVKRRELGKRLRLPLYVVSVVLWSLAFSLHYAGRVARQLRAGKGRPVKVELMSNAGTSVSDSSRQLLLGTTQKYVFLYDPAAQVTSVLPVSNIARILVQRRRSADTLSAPASAPSATARPATAPAAATTSTVRP